jgi:hypothetical protein
MVTGLLSCVPGFPADSDASDRDTEEGGVHTAEAGFPSMGKDSGKEEAAGDAEAETEAEAQATQTQRDLPTR